MTNKTVTNKAVLCYVEGSFAYFTTKPLKEQWGDDWDDAPYEHNAGTPYEEEGYDIIKIAFDGDLVTPDYGQTNSPYSVEMINSGAVAWLRSASWAKEKVAILAGTSVIDFVEKVQQAGGNVYLPYSGTSYIRL